MNVDKRWWLAGGLALASLAVWTPRLLARSSAATPPTGDTGNAPAFLADAMPLPDAVPAPPPQALTSSAAPLERVAELERLLPQLRNFGVGRPRPALDELLASFAEPTAAEATGAKPPSTADAQVATPFSELAARMRVSACLIGAHQSSAVLDGRVVRAGDELDGGLVVDAIRARSVVLRRGDERIELPLTRVARANAPSAPGTPAATPSVPPPTQ
ncbi:MAG: hypothetical protein EPO68_07740 [Planctomycetota bacterium]|nr:MAG: hypothetical protein EPO68_07740 [Planctomycetota bacterium]